MKKLIVCALSALSLANCALAQGKPLPFDTAVRTGKLANGFTYYIRHNEEPKSRVILYLVSKAGSILEAEDQRGLAHFVEHMSFNGTRHFPKNELVNYLQKSGVRFGADLNAYTSFDETVYQLPLPSDDPALMANGIQIMRDWAQEATMDPAEIDKERGVVLEEKRLGKGANERMQRQYLPLVLNHSRYSVCLPIGVDTVLNNFKPETIRRFYHDWYRPDLQALIVVGDIDVDQVEKTVKSKFGDLKNPVGEKQRISYTTTLTGKNQFIVVTDPEQTQVAIQVLIKQPALRLHTATEYRANLVRSLYNAILGERFGDLAGKPDPPFVQGGAGISAFMGGLDNWTATVVARPGQLENGFKAVWREAERAKRSGFTLTELERAKQNILRGMESVFQERHKTNSASYVDEYLQYFLLGTASPGIDYEYAMARKDLSEIDIREVNQLAATSIRETDRDILVMAPEKDKAALPDEKTVLNWMKTIQAEDLLTNADNISSLPLLQTEPEPGRIVRESRDTLLNTTELVLSNGVTVLLKPTDFKANEIQFAGFSPGGTSLYGDGDFQSAANAASIITSFGIGNYDPGQLSKYLTGKQVSVSPNIVERTQGIGGSTDPRDLETALQLVYACFTAPRKDTVLFNNLMARSKAQLENRSDDPGSVFSDSVSGILYNNIRRSGPSIQKLNQVSLERAYSIYRERFADASGLVFSFVGNIDLETIKPLLARWLGALPATHKGEQARDLGIRIVDGRLERNIYKGSEPRATVELVWSGPLEYNQANKFNLDALKECLQIRLLERLREEESGVYTPGASVTVAKKPQSRYAFVVSFGCAPGNVDKLVASTLDEIGKLKRGGPPSVNIEKWRTSLQRSYETSVKTNAFWLNYLYSQQLENEDLHQLTSYHDDLLNVTPESVKEAAGQYLKNDNFKRMVLLPEKMK